MTSQLTRRIKELYRWSQQAHICQFTLPFEFKGMNEVYYVHVTFLTVCQVIHVRENMQTPISLYIEVRVFSV